MKKMTDQMTQPNNENPAPDFNEDLAQMQRSLGARSVFVIDDSGQILLTQPPGSELDAAVLGALAAANLAATQQIANLVDGSSAETPHLLLIETKAGGILLCGAPTRRSLVIVLSEDSPLGLARLEAQGMVERLLEADAEIKDGAARLDSHNWTSEDGFGLSDDDTGLTLGIMDQIDELLG